MEKVKKMRVKKNHVICHDFSSSQKDAVKVHPNDAENPYVLIVPKTSYALNFLIPGPWAQVKTQQLAQLTQILRVFFFTSNP